MENLLYNYPAIRPANYTPVANYSQIQTARSTSTTQQHNYNVFVIILQVFTLLTVLAILGVLIFYLNKSATSVAKDNEDRIDLNAARGAIEKADFPKVLYDYKFDDESTGIFTDWSTSNVTLGEMCLAIIQGLKYAHHAASNSSQAVLVVAITENFMLRYRSKLNASASSGIPWGKNWFEFSITSTTMAAHYLLLPNVKLTDLASDIILRLIANPKLSLGYSRDGVNAVYMAGPFLLAKYFKGRVNDVWDMNQYKYVLDYIKFNIQYEQGKDGLHMDDTYSFHSGLVTYAYLKTLTTDLTTYFYRLDSGITRSPEEIWYGVRDVICHKTIGVSALGVYGRKDDISFETNTSSPLGIRVIPFARYIRYFTDKHQFSMRLMVPWYGFFEADRTTYTQSQYWTQYRNVHTINSSPSIQFPDAGFICHDDVKQLIAIPSQTTTTTVFRPQTADSFVLMYDRYGVGWQTYVISQFGSQTVTELLVIDTKTNAINITLNISNSDTTKAVVYYSVVTACDLDQYRAKLKPMSVSANTKATFATYFDLNASTVITTKRESSSNELLPLKLEDDITVDLVNNVAVLRKNGKALVICPKSQSYELPIIALGNEGTFVFDETVNQYVANT